MSVSNGVSSDTRKEDSWPFVTLALHPVSGRVLVLIRARSPSTAERCQVCVLRAPRGTQGDESPSPASGPHVLLTPMLRHLGDSTPTQPHSWGSAEVSPRLLSPKIAELPGSGVGCGSATQRTVPGGHGQRRGQGTLLPTLSTGPAERREGTPLHWGLGETGQASHSPPSLPRD